MPLVAIDEMSGKPAVTESTSAHVDRQSHAINRRIVRGSLSQFIVRIYSMFLLLILNGFAARALSTEQFAQWLVATNLIMIVSLIAMGGMNQAIVNVVAGRKEESTNAPKLIAQCWRIACLFIIGTTIVAAVLLLTGGMRWLEISPGLVLATLSCSALVAIHRLVAATLRSLHRVGIANLIDGPAAGPIPNTVLLLSMMLMAQKQWRAEQYLWIFSAALAILLPFSWWLIRVATAQSATHDRQEANHSEALGTSTDWASFFYYTLPFLISQTLTYFSTQFDVLLARSSCDAADTSLYGAARRMGLQVAMPWQIIGASAVSSMAQLHSQGNAKRLEHTMRSSALVGCLLTLPLLLACTLLPKLVLKTIFGPGFDDASAVLIIICLGQAVNCVTGQCVILLMMTGHSKHVMLSKLVAAIALTVGGLWVAPRYGILGLATVSALVLAIENIHLCLVAKQQTGLWTFPNLVWKRRAQVAEPAK